MGLVLYFGDGEEKKYFENMSSLTSYVVGMPDNDPDKFQKTEAVSVINGGGGDDHDEVNKDREKNIKAIFKSAKEK